MRVALIDGDVFIYQASAANEYEAQWEPWLWTLHADLSAAMAQFDDTLNKIVAHLEADRVIIALSDDVNWRKSVMASYKHNRVAKRKPTIYKAMREYARETRETYQRPGLEGDDILGILSTHPHLIPGEKIIVSIDKDLRTIPGTLYNDGRDTLVSITKDQADRTHLLQTLTGDTTDGYPGCPGIGPVKAEKLLGTTPNTECWPLIVAAYAKAGLSEDVALMNARVARILRSSDYDFATKTVRPWLP